MTEEISSSQEVKVSMKSNMGLKFLFNLPDFYQAHHLKYCTFFSGCISLTGQKTHPASET